MDISYTSVFHRELYRKVPRGNNEAAKKIWGEFVSRHKEFTNYGDQWIHSRTAGVSPLFLEVPWISYPAIDFLNSFLVRKSAAFEWGMGGSTIFLRRRVPTVISVEHDGKWFEEAQDAIRSSHLNQFRVRDLLPRFRSRCIYMPPEDICEPKDVFQSTLRGLTNMSFKKYVTHIDRWPNDFFDLILIDGRARPACCSAAAPKVKKGGVLVLDNSDYQRYQEPIDFLERTKLFGWERQDFLGPGPCSSCIGWRTTIWRRP
jgi:hypothetical protein